MPLGNGALTVLGWSVANATSSSGGISFYLGHQAAMSSHTELFRLGQVDVRISPNPFRSVDGVDAKSTPFAAAAPYFNQSLDIASGTMSLALGGSSAADFKVLLSLWVDANTDTVFATAAAGPGGGAFNVQVNVSSTRPAGVYNYQPPFATCGNVTSQPDVFVDPLPAPVRVSRPPALSAAESIRHATAAQRPTRNLDPLPATASFQPGSVIIYHRNYDSDGLTLNATLSQQGIASLLDTTPDHWRDLQFGFALDAGTGPALARTGANSLMSTAAGTYFEVRATALVVQTPSADDWVSDLAALVSSRAGRGALAARPAHEAWWSAFWARSYIAVNASTADPADAAAAVAGSAAAWPASATSPPVPGATLWLRASAVAQPNGSAVTTWQDESGSGWDVSQASATAQPTFLSDAFGPGAAGIAFDGAATYLQSSDAFIGTTSTIFAVFRDDGSTGGNTGKEPPCCSGVLYWLGGCNGISTVQVAAAAADDDYPTPDPVSSPIIALADYSGFSTDASTNVRGRPVFVTVQYASDTISGTGSGSSIWVDGCLEASSTRPGAPSQGGVMVGSRNAEYGRYFKGVIGEVLVYPRALNSTELAAVHAYLASRWTGTVAPKATCRAPPTPASQLSQMYALTRYTQAIQSRGTLWPIKFNGMAFIAAISNPPDSENSSNTPQYGNGLADWRDWGPSNWWQNTRLPYGAMLAAGDVDGFRVILDYYVNAEKLLGPRTQAYWGHAGAWTTETHHLSGAYGMSDYGCGNARPVGYPPQYMTSGYLHVDQGGDSGTGEWALMALDYLLYTNDTASFIANGYATLARQAADYFSLHFLGNVSNATGRISVWPAQVLETWWCEWDAAAGTWSGTNCCADDAPTISGMMTLFEKLLSLAPGAAGETAAQRAAWQHFADVLMPALPTTGNTTGGGPVIAPARVLSTGPTHNNEGPELYAVHPHRTFTKGKQVASGQDISLALSTLNASKFARENVGWNYGLNAAALLGEADMAAAQVLERAATPPADGYRFPGFAPHFQDFDPSADHFANMNRALLDMLIQPGDDGWADTSVVLFPAWPCGWDVQAKLWGPLNTSVEFDYSGGQLRSLVVTPGSRAGAVKWASCISQ